MNEDSKDSIEAYIQTREGKWVKVVRRMIKDLNFGEVQLTIHRGEIVEIRRMEKIRLEET